MEPRQPIEPVRRVVRDITRDQHELWRPGSFGEWSEAKRLEAILNSWSKQSDHERALRSRISEWVFGLIAFQIIGMFGLLVADGASWISLSMEILKVAIPSICGEIVGMGFVVVKYLFSVPVRKTLDEMVKDAGAGGLAQPPHGSTDGSAFKPISE
jgi:hypothetical protein